MTEEENSFQKLIEVLLKYRYEEQDIRILFSFFPNLPDLQLFLYTSPVLELRLATLVYKENNPEELLEGLGFSSTTIFLTLKLIQFWNWPISIDKEEVILFLKKYKIGHTNLFFALKRALALTSGKLELVYKIDQMERILMEIIKHNLYLSEEDLCITKAELEELGYTNAQTTLLLKRLLSLVKNNQIVNDKSKLLKLAIKIKYESEKK